MQMAHKTLVLCLGALIGGCEAMLLASEGLAKRTAAAGPFVPAFFPEPSEHQWEEPPEQEALTFLQMESQAAFLSPGITTMTVVLAAHNEHLYLNRTVRSLYDETPSSTLREIIVVDDGSVPPLSTVLRDFPQVRVIRNTARRGLIQSKIIGGSAAEGDMIMFLDAHVKPERDWWKPILKHINTNYKRVVVPVITVLDGDAWKPKGNAAGAKMMFDWGMDFNWFDDHNDLVPVASGGLFGISRKWWHESGEYDDTMQYWGGENIEQSFRVWLCGGEIRVARDSRIGHVFRKSFPYSVNFTEVNMNLVRTVETWLDGYKPNFYASRPHMRDLRDRMGPGSINTRQELKQRLSCKPFQWYVDKFHNVFEKLHMLPETIFHIKDATTGLCLEVASAEAGSTSRTRMVRAEGCVKDREEQQWWASNGRIGNVANKACLDANAGKHKFLATYPCLDMFAANGDAIAGSPIAGTQLWALDAGHLKLEGMCAEVQTAVEQSPVRLSNCSEFPKKSSLEMVNSQTRALR